MGKRSLSASAPAQHLNDEWRKLYLERLLNWFQLHRRDLPWRKTRDPYAVWISESMLQQTQVATVIGYYLRFLKAFPNVHALAEAPEQEVLAMWAGLGYYRRARQLHAAAKKVVELHGGLFPIDSEQLQALPGIGRYTAGAIASIALGLPAPIVEANTERLFARLLKLEQPVRDPEPQRALWAFAQWQLGQSGQPSQPGKPHRPDDSSPTHAVDEPMVAVRVSDPGCINQAAMELGSLICKPVAPRCLVCPLVELCPTAKAGLQQQIPPPKAKKIFSSLHHVNLIVHQRGRWLMRLNPAGAWWHGLWDFPRVDVTELGLRPPTLTNSRSRTALSWDDPTRTRVLKLTHQQLLGDKQRKIFLEINEPILSLSHGVTRYRITLDAMAATVDSQYFKGQAEWCWADTELLSKLPLTAIAKKMLTHLGK